MILAPGRRASSPSTRRKVPLGMLDVISMAGLMYPPLLRNHSSKLSDELEVSWENVFAEPDRSRSHSVSS